MALVRARRIWSKAVSETPGIFMGSMVVVAAVTVAVVGIGAKGPIP